MTTAFLLAPPLLPRPSLSLSPPRRSLLAPRRLPSRPTASALPLSHAASAAATSASSALLAAFSPDPSAANSLTITAVVLFLSTWGLVSFLKGSTKLRTTQAAFVSTSPPADISRAVGQHFSGRNYVADAAADGRKGVITYKGQVAPSVFLASLLAFCASAGIASVILVLNEFYLPDSLRSPAWYALTLVGLAAGAWYWTGAEREEEVKVMIEVEEGGENKVWLKGHRDEILAFQEGTGLRRIEEEELDAAVAKSTGDVAGASK